MNARSWKYIIGTPIALMLWIFLYSSTAAEDNKYEFTSDWVTKHEYIWQKHLKPFQDKPHIKALEIGSFEGRSAIWFLDKILTHPTSSITTIDIFSDEEYEKRFDRNIQTSGLSSRVKKMKGVSQEVLRALKPDGYDFVYIDGSHKAKDVLVDTVLSWDLLKTGGIIIFDDYLWRPRRPASERPQIAIDAFLDVFHSYIVVLHREYQVIIKKRDKPEQTQNESWFRENLRSCIKMLWR